MLHHLANFLIIYDLKFIFPDLHISTSDAYRCIVPKALESNRLDIINNSISSWKGRIKNDFEAVVFSKHPELAYMKEGLYKDGAIYASMTGSGSVLYGIFSK